MTKASLDFQALVYDPNRGYLLNGTLISAEKAKQIKRIHKVELLVFKCEEDTTLPASHQSLLAGLFEEVLLAGDVTENVHIVYNRYKRVLEFFIANKEAL